MTTSSFVLVTTATLFDAVVLARILFRDPPKLIDMQRVIHGAWTLALIGTAQILTALLLAHSYFLMIALLYAHLMLLVPAASLALLWASRTRAVTRGIRIAACAGLLIAPIFVSATFIEPYRLVTESVDVEIAHERMLPIPLLIGVLADLQCVEVTDRERDAVTRIMAAKPDLIVLPGDLQQAGLDHIDEIGPQLRDLLAPLSAPLGVWYVEGNTESTAEARRLLAGTPVRILEDEIVHLDHAGAQITLCGVGLGFDTPNARVVLREMEAWDSSDEVRILLAHRPDAMLALTPGTRVDLVIAGHTHGGQVQLPFIGPLVTLSSVPRHIAAGGLHELDGRRTYVSRGIGWEHGHAPRVRFFCTPEVSMLRLTSRRPGS